MFRHIGKFLLAIVLIFVIFVWFIQPSFVSSYLSRTMNVPVSLSSIAIRPSKTSIRNFQIDNPPGFGGGAAFKALQTNIYYSYKKFFANPVEIDEIVLDDVYLNIILPSNNVSHNNWTDLGQRMPDSKGGKPVLIHKLILNRLTVETEGKGARNLKIAGVRHFNRMEFNEINSAEGFPTKELARRIFQDAGILNYLEQFLNPKNIKKTIQFFKSFTENETPEFPQGSLELKDHGREMD